MKSACEYNRELLNKVIPKMSYKGEDYEEWKIVARKKLSLLIGLDRFKMLANCFEMSDLLAMAYPKIFIQVNGINDPIFPLAGAEEVFKKGRKVYEENACEKRCVMVKGNVARRFYADDAWPIVHKLINIK